MLNFLYALALVMISLSQFSLHQRIKKLEKGTRFLKK